MAGDFVRFEGIRKTFMGVTALDDVTFSLARGECHCLMGENGAGKSTLGKILAGIHRPDEGRLFIDGREHRFYSPADALRAGVGMVHQELAFCPDLTVAENLCMGVYPRRGRFFVDHAKMRQRSIELLARIGVQLDVDRPMRELTTAQEQLVQIAAAVGTNAQILIFDEPTSSLSEVDAQRLLALIEDLKSRGVTIVYVSHRMPEVFRVGDRITVLRDGRYVGTLTRAEATQDRVVQMMIGRSIEAYFPQHLAGNRGQRRLTVRNLSSPGKFRDINFHIDAGEIVGFAGLVGSGRSEVATAIFGLDRAATGTVEVEGQPLPLGNIRKAMRCGIGLLPEDRKRQGLVLDMSCLNNFTLAMLERLSRFGFLRHRQARRHAMDYFERLRVKTASIHAPVSSLSGGNQQKVALAKWLGRGCNVLIVDEPTRGVDIGAKAQIYQLINDLAVGDPATGRPPRAVLMVSSYLPELLGVCDRIAVMSRGVLGRARPVEQWNEHALMAEAIGQDAAGNGKETIP